ncbi:hypothetical protein TW84_15865 [Vibrio neptunius]|nr:hypothetical protein TW84_15865 [Vibrio neptunius]
MYPIEVRLSLKQKFLTKIRRWRRNYRTRHQLEQLSERMLRDIGVEQKEALRESRRTFWDD